MAWQGVKTVILFLCCIDLDLSQSSKPISTLDHFSGVDYDYSDGEADSGHELKSELAVYCNNNTMKVILPSGPLSQVEILGKYSICLFYTCNFNGHLNFCINIFRFCSK